MQAPEPSSGRRKEESPAMPAGSGPPRAPQPTLKLELADAEDEALSTRISHYKLLERVGEAGCGVVYVAEQTKPVCHRVALKAIKLGMDTRQVVARFEAERQALAMMDHTLTICPRAAEMCPTSDPIPVARE
jgi:hypothetical protein